MKLKFLNHILSFFQLFSNLSLFEVLTTLSTMMKSNKQDTFLVGHARRMHECRKRQKEQDPLAYALRMNLQQQQYRLRTRVNILLKKQETSKLEAILQARKCNRERQRRYRSKLSNEQKSIIRKNDRNKKRLKRNQTLTHFNDDDANNSKTISNIMKT